MVFGLKDFVLGSVCFSFICILSCLMGQKKIVLKYIVFYVVIAAIQQLCIYLPQAIETILSIFTLFIRVMIPVVLFASTFIATTKVSELIAAMYSLKIPRSITITFAMPYQVMLDRYQQTIRELHIEKLKDRNLFDLSGGQKQTIAFASVYALNPDIFVLDEPSSNLDPEAIQELRRLLLLIKAQGKTIVVSEHRLYFLNGIADRIVLMEHGKLKQSWSASDFALFNAEQIKALGLRSYTPTRLELPDTMPSRNEPPAVEVKDLAIGYEKGEPVAQHLNFRVYPGEIVGVVGKNGCGKSTLARTLCGLQKELRGEVLYKNSVVPSKRRIRKAYLVMQDPDYQLFTDSVYQELLLALSDQKDKDEKRIDDILDELNLTIYKERHPMSLSGGQKQRTAIGVAALRDAEVLIFDEPTSGLDYKNMESVAEILSALSKRGKAILVISHDNELLMKICSRVIRVDERTSS